MNIVGLSAGYHDSSACLVRDGVLVTAVQEERFSRIKNDSGFPSEAFHYCLSGNDLDILDVDCIAYYENPRLKAERQLAQGLDGSPMPAYLAFDPERPIRTIRRLTGFDGPIEICMHHEAHAASAYYMSGFEAAAVMVVDAVGEWTTISFWDGADGRLTLLAETRFPHSLGLAYSAVTNFLGFRVNEDEYKVMGLAPYGRPVHLDKFRDWIRVGAGFDLAIDLGIFDAGGRQAMYTPALGAALAMKPRQPTEPIELVHVDLAASLQARLNEVLIAFATRVAAHTGRRALCLAGGVALNSVGIGAIRDAGIFDHIFVQPAAGDAGTAIGAAMLAHVRRGHVVTPIVMQQGMLGCGPETGTDGFLEDLATLQREGRLPAGLVDDYGGSERALLERVAAEIVAGAVVGWCHDAMEFGPRALGRRSILADPRRPDIRDRINRLVKNRETFRPFAPAVLEERAIDHFELVEPNRFMTEVCAVIGRQPFPAVTHVDGTARPQTVPNDDTRFRRLLERFAARTGCPVLLNTSLNVNGMPIARTARDALGCFLRTKIDIVVIGDLVLNARSLPKRWRELWLERGVVEHEGRKPSDAVYSFI